MDGGEKRETLYIERIQRRRLNLVDYIENVVGYVEDDSILVQNPL